LNEGGHVTGWVSALINDSAYRLAARVSCEFMAADLDGNLIRVFYDFRGDL
jgi:hypothetical protein